MNNYGTYYYTHCRLLADRAKKALEKGEKRYYDSILCELEGKCRQYGFDLFADFKIQEKSEIKSQPQPVAQTTKKEASRICEAEGCSTKLTGKQGKFCSKTCCSAVQNKKRYERNL